MQVLLLILVLCVAAAGVLGRERSVDVVEYQQFDVDNALLTRPFGVNDSGEIVGLYRDAANVAHGFLRHPD